MLVLEKKLVKYKIEAESYTLIKQDTLYMTAELFSIFETKLFENFSQEAKHKMLLLEHDFFAERPELLLLAQKLSTQLVSLQKYIQELLDDKI